MNARVSAAEDVIDKEQALERTLSSLRFCRRGLQRRRRQRLPGLHRAAHARRPRLGGHRRESELSRTPSRPRRPRRPGVRSPSRNHPHERARAARVPRQSDQSLLLLQARAVHPPGPSRRRPSRHRRRRQQRRRSRRLPSRSAGGARIRRAQPARRGRSGQGRNPRAVAAGRAVDLGRAGVRLSVVAHSVPHGSDRREAPDHRARRSRRFIVSDSASVACAITTSSRGSRSDATRWPPRSSRRCAPPSCAS